jgi:hypothetical protein
LKTFLESGWYIHPANAGDTDGFFQLRPHRKRSQSLICEMVDQDDWNVLCRSHLEDLLRICTSSNVQADQVYRMSLVERLNGLTDCRRLARASRKAAPSQHGPGKISVDQRPEKNSVSQPTFRPVPRNESFSVASDRAFVGVLVNKERYPPKFAFLPFAHACRVTSQLNCNNAKSVP